MEIRVTAGYACFMEKECRVFLVGDSLFTESLAQMLAEAEDVRVMGTAVFTLLDKTAVMQSRPHIIIIAGAGPHHDVSGDLLATFAGIPIIHADLNQDYVQIITSRRVSARRTDLLAAIDELSRQRSD